MIDAAYWESRRGLPPLRLKNVALAQPVMRAGQIALCINCLAEKDVSEFRQYEYGHARVCRACRNAQVKARRALTG